MFEFAFRICILAKVVCKLPNIGRQWLLREATFHFADTISSGSVICYPNNDSASRALRRSSKGSTPNIITAPKIVIIYHFLAHECERSSTE